MNLIYIYFRLLSCVLGEASHGKQQESRDHPLELSDIMPFPQKTYDKMRPPKYKGKTTSALFCMYNFVVYIIYYSSIYRIMITTFNSGHQKNQNTK